MLITKRIGTSGLILSEVSESVLVSVTSVKDVLHYSTDVKKFTVILIIILLKLP